MEALTILGTAALLPLTQAQERVDDVTVSKISVEAWVGICLVCVLPVGALILIWSSFVYFIRKNELNYEKACKDIESKRHYLMRRQQHIKRMQKTKDPASKNFNKRATGIKPNHPPVYAQHVHRGQPSAAAGNRGYHVRRKPGAENHVLQPRIQHPHLLYQHYPQELRQHQHSQHLFQASAPGSRQREGSNLERSRGHASTSTSPFYFKSPSSSQQYAGVMPAKDYPGANQQKRPSSQPSNYMDTAYMYGQLSKWPQFN